MSEPGWQLDLKQGGDDAAQPPEPLPTGAHVLPKLLCGLYGGFFSAAIVPQSMGVGPFRQLGCSLDGSRVTTYNNDLF